MYETSTNKIGMTDVRAHLINRMSFSPWMNYLYPYIRKYMDMSDERLRFSTVILVSTFHTTGTYMTLGERYFIHRAQAISLQKIVLVLVRRRWIKYPLQIYFYVRIFICELGIKFTQTWTKWIKIKWYSIYDMKTINLLK